MQCPAGHANQPDATFCSTCGLALAPAAAPPPQGWSAPPGWGQPGVPQAPQGWGPGYPPPGYPPYGPPPGNRLGSSSLTIGILSIFFCGVGGIAAIILGILGLQRANRGEATNRGSSIAGIVLGSVAILLWILLAIGLAASESATPY